MLSSVLYICLIDRQGTIVLPKLGIGFIKSPRYYLHLFQLNLAMAALAKVTPMINTAIANARPKFNIFMQYARVELAPPKLSEIGEIKAGISRLLNSAKSGAWKNQTVKQATANTLVGMEVLFWFYIGECIGKRHFVGYEV